MGRKDKSKRLAYLLRHDTEYKFAKGGWREVNDLVRNHKYTKEELEDIVVQDDKGRYEFSKDHNKIRATQGHSVNVDVELEIMDPPDILYHGTASRFLDSIKEKGILRMSRLYVQLSKNIKTAEQVGARHGKPIILPIDTKRMKEDGVVFKHSRNGVWMTDHVDPGYIKFDEIIYGNEQ